MGPNRYVLGLSSGTNRDRTVWGDQDWNCIM